MSELEPIAMPGAHEIFFKYFKEQKIPVESRILDVGAGHGAFTKKLYDLGYAVQACEFVPELFAFDKIECKKVDITKSFPYDDDTFDVVIAVEVTEHILDHETFFSELNRILKPGGKAFLTTPNILSMKSRMRFLFRGFFYSFGALDNTNFDGMQHVASITANQYNYLGAKYGFEPVEISIDKKQSTSLWLLIIFMPFMWLNAVLNQKTTVHNDTKLLLGRKLFMCFRNKV